MVTKQELEANADAVLAAADQETDPVKQFAKVWNGIIKPVLELVKSFTGSRIDDQISKLEYAADALCNGTNVDAANYCQAWNDFHLKGLLKMIQVFTGP